MPPSRAQAARARGARRNRAGCPASAQGRPPRPGVADRRPHFPRLANCPRRRGRYRARPAPRHMARQPDRDCIAGPRGFLGISATLPLRRRNRCALWRLRRAPSATRAPMGSTPARGRHAGFLSFPGGHVPADRGDRRGLRRHALGRDRRPGDDVARSSTGPGSRRACSRRRRAAWRAPRTRWCGTWGRASCWRVPAWAAFAGAGLALAPTPAAAAAASTSSPITES